MAVVSISRASSVENGYVTFQITLDEAALDAVSVDYRTILDGSADDDDIYYSTTGSSNNGTITFAPGETVATARVYVGHDTIDEVDEFFSLELSNVTAGSSLANGETTMRGTGIISDNDGAGTNLAVFVTNPVIVEGDVGQKFAEFSIELSQAATSNFSMSYWTKDGTAQAGEDYTAKSGNVNFVVGQSTATVSVPVSSDFKGEASEFFSLIVVPPTNPLINSAEAVGEATILDDDSSASGVVVSVADGEAIENGYMRFTVNLSKAALDAVSFDYHLLLDGSADTEDIYYTTYGSNNSGEVVFAPGQTTQEILIYTGSDNTAETDETFSLHLSNISQGAAFAGGENTLTATGVISDDDGTGLDRALHVSDPTFIEGDDGQKYAEFTLMLTEPASQAFNTYYNTIDGSAVAGDDYESTSGYVRFNIGQQYAAVRVPIISDSIAENTEFFSLRASPQNDVLYDTTSAVGIATIQDDDTGPVVVSISSVDAVEADISLFTVTLSKPALDSVTLSYRVLATGEAVEDDFDYDLTSTSNNKTITFLPGQTTAEIYVDTRSDNTDETDEHFSVELFNLSTIAQFAGGENTLSATSFVLDDDGVGSNLSLSVSDPTILEGDGDQTVAVFDIELSRAPTSSITVSYRTEDGTAAPGIDYQHTQGTIIFVAGQTHASVHVPISSDGLAEDTKTFSLVVSPVGTTALTGNGEAGTATILDDDGPIGPVINIAPSARETEGESTRFVVTLSEASDQAITFDYAATLGGTASEDDLGYSLSSSRNTGTFTFTPGTTSGSIFIYNDYDSTDERDESFFLELSNPGNASFAGGKSELRSVGFILDDDGVGLNVALAATPYTVVETGQAYQIIKVPVALSRTSNSELIFDVSSINQSAGGADYQLLTSTLTFAPGQTEADVTVRIFMDALTSELPETFELAFSPQAGMSFGGVIESTTITIQDGPNYIPTGTDGDDNIGGTIGNDVIYGNNGYDVLSGLAGDDQLIGGYGKDTLYGDFGNDTLLGGAGNDTLYGGFGDDRLYGEDGNDLLNGGDGNDYLVGNDGNDVLLGGDGHDNMHGRAGNDYLYGGDGNDILRGFEGDDYLVGNEGNDLLVGGLGEDVLQGREGNDRLFGEDGNDWLFGFEGDDYMVGNAGNDFIAGYEGNDSMFGSEGNDFMYGMLGADYMKGGDGDDRMVGNEGGDALYGEAGNDSLFGYEGNDRLYGGDGNDYMKGGDGNDILDGGDKFDSLFGEAGVDTFVFAGDWRHDKVQDWEEGETLDMSSQGTNFASLTIAQSGADTIINITGDSYNSITLIGIDADTIDAGDFYFG